MSYFCENCGKEVFTKYGSGRFCCRACANARKPSTETKEKISVSTSKAIKEIWQNNPDKWLNTNRKKRVRSTCKICGKALGFKNKTGYCNDCIHNTVDGRNIYRQTSGGYRKGAGIGKHGYYKGFYCESTYELALVIYCLDHNIQIERNKKYFEYTYNNTLHKYYPDFIINNEYIEVKGYHTDLVDIKAQAVKNAGYNIKILYKKDLSNIFEYIKEHYNYKQLQDLYE